MKSLIPHEKTAVAGDDTPCFVVSENLQSCQPDVSQESFLMQFANRRFLLLLVTGAILFTGSLWAQDKAADGQDKKDAKDTPPSRSRTHSNAR